MALANARQGGSNFVATGQQVVPGGAGDAATLVSATNYLQATTDTMKAPWEMEDGDVMVSSRLTHLIREAVRVVPAGQIGYYLNPVLGLDFLLAALGAKSTLSPTAVVATSANITTAAGVSTLTFASGAAWPIGGYVYINTDVSGVPTASTERRVVLDGSTNTSLKVAALTTNAATTTGTKVMAPGQDKYALSLLPSGHEFELLALTLESNRGRQWSFLYGMCFVDKFSIDLASKLVTATADIVSAGQRPTFANSGTTPAMGAYNPSTSDAANALKPFSGRNSYVVFKNDPSATATSTLQVAPATNVKVNYDNKFMKELVLDGGEGYQYFPDTPMCEFSGELISTAKRNDLWDDLLAANAATPLHIDMSRNNGTTAAPVYRGISLYAPNVKLDTADATSALGKTNMVTWKGQSIAAPGQIQDLVVAYVL